jgi:glucose/mannose transport system substrate-binding protein
MLRSRRGILAATAAAMLFAVTACGDDGADSGSGQSGDKEVEVFSWWSGPGEAEGLAALISEFEKQNSGVKFVNAAVAGGSGTQARQVLTTRLAGGQPPDSYQLHAGQEAASDIKDGRLEDITALYDKNGWRDKFPKGLIDAITVDGKLYTVPVNIHRSNLLWYSPNKLKEWGIAAPPKTWAEFLTQAETLKGKGVKPLSVGTTWTQMHLMENVLLGELGASKYTGLWNGSTDWAGADVVAALGTFTKVMAVAEATTADWQPEAKKVLDGTVAYNVMGDWYDAYAGRDQKKVYGIDYAAAPTPGSDGIYNFLSDSFTLPKGAPHRTAAEKWLELCGSVQGQDLFNPQKGSIPARTDADKTKYTGYLASALGDWQNSSTTIVGSLVHGVVANNAWKSEMEKAYGVFAQDKDAAKFAGAVKSAYNSVGK